MSVTIETSGPRLLTADGVGDWCGREQEAAAVANDWIQATMRARHGLIWTGAGWVVVVESWASGGQVSGLPDWGGECPLDFDAYCNDPAAFGFEL